MQQLLQQMVLTKSSENFWLLSRCLVASFTLVADLNPDEGGISHYQGPYNRPPIPVFRHGWLVRKMMQHSRSAYGIIVCLGFGCMLLRDCCSIRKCPGCQHVTACPCKRSRGNIFTDMSKNHRPRFCNCAQRQQQQR